MTSYAPRTYDLTEAEKKKLQRAADKERLSVSQLIARAVRDYLKKRTK